MKSQHKELFLLKGSIINLIALLCVDGVMNEITFALLCGSIYLHSHSRNMNLKRFFLLFTFASAKDEKVLCGVERVQCFLICA
jgi:hypothetical protein